ncbi:Endoribonuclease Dicer like [Schistosoma japonicum]|nr:Endoribonuclease Dicer like [Schistosoma japonicum]KAH8852555.1 Endoribonuclease Dicer like [Schistosoma japonicum]KAH8852557.1 Endoribonuclease Dicer like [Schistosoma japonicum]KAH8852558.1 Endoribonuclease Dicer like [Schistosoma japonicum]KAH8852559.1 Endoribonuclease Dicer like [Schistosoma japonicum]
MWTPPICDNPPPFNLKKELLPTVISESSSKSSGVSSTTDGLDYDPSQGNCTQYTMQNIRYQFYPIPRIRCLSFPYQTLPSCGSTVFLYIWTLPRSGIMTRLCSLDATCFRNIDMAIGLLFSQPISKKDYVCRIPLYLTRGMVRSRVRLVRKLILNENELKCIESTHSVIAELITNIGHMSHVGYKPSDPLLRAYFDKQGHLNNVPECFRVTISNGFADLSFNPEKAIILSLMTLIQLPDYTVDYEALNALLEWSQCRANASSSADGDLSVNVKPVHGIVPKWRIRLSQIPQDDWVGLVVRPNHLPDGDPGMFSVSAVCSETALSNVPRTLASKLNEARSPEGASQVTYFDYYTIKYQQMKSISSSINLSLPLFKCMRITRHQNSAQVNAGLRKNKLSVNPSIFLSDACLVHPLSSWIWFQVSLIPVILYQMSRALLASQLCTELNLELKNPQPFSQIRINSLNISYDSLSDITVLIPDRLSVSVFVSGERMEQNIFDFEVDEATSEKDKELDNKAYNESVKESKICPHPNNLIEPTTLLGARDAVDLERLEFYGDSFLHFVATLSVYGTSAHDADEGYLSSKRGSLVSNAHLCDIACDLKWYEYCTGKIFNPPEHFLPPCYTVASEVRKHDPRLYTRLSDKSLADMVEAIIGCFLLRLGLPAAFNLLHYFQICPVNWNTLTNDKHFDVGAPWHLLLQPNLYSEQNVLNSSNRSLYISLPETIHGLNKKFSHLQQKLGYYFKRIELLAEAMTHQSSPNKQFWGNYQRLEFLGDSILGHIVSNYLFRKCPSLPPGKLTAARSAIVSNNNLANTVVEHEIYPFIDFGTCSAKACIDEILNIHHQTELYCERIELLTKKVSSGLNIKVLADVFESILGAVFVDTNGNHQIIQTIVNRFLGKSMHTVIINLPVQPLQQLNSPYPNTRYKDSAIVSSNLDDSNSVSDAVWTSSKRLCATESVRDETHLRFAEDFDRLLNDKENRGNPSF